MTSISSKKASATFVSASSATATSTPASSTPPSRRDAQPKGNWKGTEEIITYKVERGDRHKLAGIEVTGNHYFNTELLRARLQIYGKGFATRGRFSRRLVESDRDSLLSLYQSNGFLEAKVDAQTLDNYKGVEGQLFVRYVIQEGKQSRVASLSIDGNHAFKEDELLPYVASTPGQPYSDYNVATDRDNILALYYNEGFPEARFTANATPITPEPSYWRRQKRCERRRKRRGQIFD